MHEYRTHKCSDIRLEHVGQKIKLAGWVETVRDLGGVVFIDLRDQYGITQVVASGNDKLVDMASRIPNESTISVLGTVRRRDEETINKNIVTGEVELFAEEINILGKRLKNLPFEVNENNEVREDLRLQYRFLDLRNDRLKENLLLRAKVLQ